MNITDIRFPNLGILLSDISSGISIGGFEIKFYGIIIASGFLMGLWAAMQEARSLLQPGQVITRVSGHIFRWQFHSSVT